MSAWEVASSEPGHRPQTQIFYSPSLAGFALNYSEQSILQNFNSEDYYRAIETRLSTFADSITNVREQGSQLSETDLQKSGRG